MVFSLAREVDDRNAHLEAQLESTMDDHLGRPAQGRKAWVLAILRGRYSSIT